MTFSERIFEIILAAAAAVAAVLTVGVAIWAIAQTALASRQRDRDARRLVRQRQIRAARGSRVALDNPIVTSSQDLFGRARVAHDLASELRLLDSTQGLVVGVLGPWGSGKSSFVNLMRESFKQEPSLDVVEFNPWMFSGTQQLADVFFKEVAAELRLADPSKFSRIADAFDDYSDALNPLVPPSEGGALWNRSYRTYRTARKRWRARSAVPLKEDIAEALSDLSAPVIVVVDDIDRLSRAEIRAMFKLVRLTASFPNVIYLLSFDRERVEAALTDATVAGRAYLEKIIQLSFDLPSIPRESLRAQLVARLNMLLEDVPDVRFDSERWPDVFIEIVEPLLRTMRDVVRLALSARPTMIALGHQVESVDLLALESLRVFRPGLFSQLSVVRDALTEISGDFTARTNPKFKAQIDSLLEANPGDRELITQLIVRLFPAANQYVQNQSYGREWLPIWKTARRVAQVDFLNLYFERSASSGVASLLRSETALSLFGDRGALDSYLRGLDPADLEETIAGLETYEQSFQKRDVVPVSIVLMNLIPAIPERDPQGMFDFARRDIVVERVVLRLLRQNDDESRRASSFSRIFSGVRTYSGRLALIRLASPTNKENPAMISEDAAQGFEQQLAERIVARRPREPADEWDLVRVLNFALERTQSRQLLYRLKDLNGVRALFRSARSVSQVQSMNSRHVRSEERLWWDGLLRVMGDEYSLRRAAEVLREGDGPTSLVLLVERYVAGWRPKDHWDKD